MPALANQSFYAIENYIRERAINERYQAQPNIRQSHLKSLLYPKELHDFVDQINSTFQTSGAYGISACVDGVAYSISGRIPYLPLKKVYDVQSDEVDPIAWDVRTYLQEYVDIGKRWGKVKFLVSELNNICTNLAQMRFVFPGIVMLLDGIKSEKANDIREAKMPRNMPPLRPEIRLLCKEVTEFLAVQSLLPMVDRQSRDYGIAVSASHVGLPDNQYVG